MFLEKNFFFQTFSFRIKYLLLKEMGVDFILNIKFNTHLVNLNPRDFIENILVKKLKGITCCYWV